MFVIRTIYWDRKQRDVKEIYPGWVFCKALKEDHIVSTDHLNAAKKFDDRETAQKVADWYNQNQGIAIVVELSDNNDSLNLLDDWKDHEN